MINKNNNIKNNGVNILPIGVKRNIVNGGGLTAIQDFPDDE